jgi:uncharacterized protein
MRTLGIFAKQPVPGRVKTRLAVDWGNERAAALYECFVRDLLTRFATVGDRRVIGFAPDSEEARRWFETVSTSPDDAVDSGGWILWPQPNSDLGGRMAACFETWAETPDHRTILIGSDSPTLPVEYLERAWRLLQDNDCVLGPASDGGYYLIGLRGSLPEFAAPFRDVDWSTAGVLSKTVENLKQHNLSLGLLPVWYDVDSVDAVETLTGHLAAFRHAGQTAELPATSHFLGQT